MTFQQLIAVLRARWIIALSTFALIVATVTTLTLLWSKSYTATASIVLDIKNPDPIAGMVLQGAAAPSYLMTQLDIVSSSRVALKVVKSLHLSDSNEMRTRWKEATNGTGDYEGWLADLIRLRLDVRPSRGSNVIYVSYTANDPKFAAAVANAFVQSYLESSMELRTGPAKQYNDFFEARAQNLRADLEAAQRRLSQFQQEHGLVGTDERLDVETARLNELSTQYVLQQAALADSGSRQSAANNQTDRSPEVIANPLISGLRSDLVRSEAQLEQLSTRLGDKHPQVIELRTNIAELRQKLEAEIKRVTGSVGVANTVNQSRTAQVKAALDEQRAKVLKLKAVRDQAAILERDVENAQRAYDGIAARMSMTSLESQANESTVSALEYATPPALPSSPRTLLNIALSILGGLVASIAVALLFESRDRRVRTYAELETLFDQPLLGAIPSFSKLKTQSGSVPERFQLSQSKAKALPNNA
ncbi:MAG TPA: chain length determinant protein EpsF [Aquabacterium sp.]|nr:chain length determinant protein EpsF [Aquabacterium sp.]